MLALKGSFSYTQNNVNFMDLDNGLTIRIECIDEEIARVYLVDAHGVQQPIPANITMINAAGHVLPIVNDMFLITWINSYTLSVNGQPRMVLNNQKQQAINGPLHALSGVLAGG
ncbi:hypothetical protein COCOBI_10-5310 [Coccomyxa sp. Obi]|nr:hypothetical protein COCOBI_10-5310 [Coccomyxa sp. Obi]